MEETMPQPQAATLDRAELMKTIQRCAEAYFRVRAELPPNSIPYYDQANNYKASLAFLAQIPVLYDLASFQLYIACIAQGAAIGAIDPADVGRFCHIAQTAISAWKLANLIVPAAQRKEMESEEKAKYTRPLPTKGNHPQNEETSPPTEEDRQAAASLPDRSTQDALYKSLRQRGIPVPSEINLRRYPLLALYYCDLAQHHLDKLPPMEARPGPTPGPESSPAPQQEQNQAA